MTDPTKLSDLSGEAQLKLGLDLGNALISIRDLQARGQLRFFLTLSIDADGHVISHAGAAPGSNLALVVGAIEEVKLCVRQQLSDDARRKKP